MTPLSRHDFETALAAGMGRAVLHVREHGAAGLEDLILDATLHNRSLDHQIDGDRAAWMLGICREAGLLERCRDEAIGRALRGFTEDDAEESSHEDIWQVQELLRLLALEGDAEARTVLLASFGRHGWNRQWCGFTSIIPLDGIDGLLFVCRRMIAEEGDEVDVEWAISIAEEALGKDATWDALETAASDDPSIGSMLERVRTWREEREARTSPSPPTTAKEFFGRIENGSTQFIYASGLLRDLSAPERALVARRLQTEEDPLILRRLIWAFQRAHAGEATARLLGLATHSEEDLRRGARRALGNIDAPEVRALVVELAGEDGSEPGETLGALRSSYRAEDEELVERIVRSSIGADDFHEVTTNLVRLAETAGVSTLAGALVVAIEHAACSDCRYHLMREAARRGALPRALTLEARLDAHERIRALAKEILGAAGGAPRLPM